MNLDGSFFTELYWRMTKNIYISEDGEIYKFKNARHIPNEPYEIKGIRFVFDLDYIKINVKNKEKV